MILDLSYDNNAYENKHLFLCLNQHNLSLEENTKCPFKFKPKPPVCNFWVNVCVCIIVCVRSCDQKPYLPDESKGGICIKIEFNPQNNISLLQNDRLFFVYSSNMAAVMLCEHSIFSLG